MIITSVLLAQTNFEGTIKWGMSMTSAAGTPAKTPELSAKQKAELQDNIAKLEQQMNDPQMQAMFQSNPSLKATLEQQLQSMKLMQGDGGVSNLLPKSYTVKIKDGNSYTTVDGGAMAAMGDILYLKSTNKTYFIKTSAKTYSVSPKSASASATTDNKTVTVAPTTETKKILTYNCTKYIVTITENGVVQTMNIWATKDLKQYNAQSFQTDGVGQKSMTNAFKEIDGVPLRIEMTEKGQSVVMEVLELNNTPLSTSDFVLPAGFKEVPFGQ